MTTLHATSGPRDSRLVGRSRTYTSATLSPRLHYWHAPRVNRWEKLCVGNGTLGIEYLQANGTTRTDLAAGDTHWFAPGTRWRVTVMHEDCHFELEIHADTQGQAKAPQPLRSRVLEQTDRCIIANRADFDTFITALPVASRQLIDGRFPMPAWTDLPKGQGHLFWHPLAASKQSFSVLIARSREPFDLADYLGRDHAIIEAALGQALIGDAEAKAWMLATLERHLHIEEDLLFPAWLAAGGTPGHVQGLKNEHVLLREHLQSFDDPEHQRKLLRLLDAHDEKEEQVVYPDMVARLTDDHDLLQRSIAMPVPACIRAFPA